MRLSSGSLGIALTLLLGGCSGLEGSRPEEGRSPTSGDRVERVTRVTAKAEAAIEAEPALLKLEEQAEPIFAARDEKKAPSGSELDPEQALVATAQQTFVYRDPSFKSEKLGYLRAGAVVSRSQEPNGFEGCKGGFYRIEPEGYVCVGPRAALDKDHILTQALIRRADRGAPLPYSYGLSRRPPPPLYTRIPTIAEQDEVERGFKRPATNRGIEEWKPFGVGPIPEFLRDGQSSLRSNGTRQSSLVLQAGRAVPKSGFALLDVFEANNRAFGLTADLAVIPLDRLRPIEPSGFHGLPLDKTTTLPVVFVR
jgi:hypothetical protein